jgi:hypothetical protein
VRCALNVETGRGGRAPTLRQAGRFPDGSKYDLGPDLAPLTRPSPVPDFSTAKVGSLMQASARDAGDLNHILDIGRQRGLNPYLHDSTLTESKALPTEVTMNFGGAKIPRSLARTAATGACVLFGNSVARAHLDPALLSSIKTGAPHIEDHAGWDYANDWPAVVSVTPHGRTTGELGSFEHSLMVLDVGDDWVGYVRLFGAFQFSVRLALLRQLPVAWAC